MATRQQILAGISKQLAAIKAKAKAIAKEVEKRVAAVKPPVTPKVVTVEPGEKLWNIAERELGSGARWKELKTPEGKTFTEAGARRLQIGQKLVIPQVKEPVVKPPVTPAITPASISDISKRLAVIRAKAEAIAKQIEKLG